MGDLKSYNFGQIQSAAAAHRASVQEVQSLQAELDGHMKRLHGVWTSASASPAQQQAHATWSKANHSIHQICAQRGVKTGEAGTNMESTERANAHRFT